MAVNWGMAAGGAEAAMQALLEERILQEKMALAQRQQQAEEQHRAAQLAEQAAGRGDVNRRFDAELGFNREKFGAEAPDRAATVRLKGVQADTGAYALGRQQTDDANQDAADAALSSDPTTASLVRFRRAGIPITATDPNDVTGDVAQSRRLAQIAASGDQSVRAASVRAAGMGSGTRPMTQGQRAALAAGLRKDYNANVKEARTIGKQVELMNRAWEGYDKNPNAASQGLLVTFQKILDPTSVVRESEYARTFDGQAMLDQMAGAFERLRQGGSGVPREQLEGFKQLAEQFAAGYAAKAQEYQGVIDANADEFGIDKRLVYTEGEFGGGTPAPATGGAAPRKGRYNPTTKRIEY
jgi:hypothetical protein